MMFALWGLGYADQAQQRCQEALALAQQLGHLPTLLLAEVHTILLSQHCRCQLDTFFVLEALKL
jgi:hypothetical protein